MKFPAVRLNGVQARAVARGFGSIIPVLKLRVYECSILPDHVHLVIERHCDLIEDIVGYLKRAATRQLNREHRHPLAEYRRKNGELPSPWVEGGWVRYLNDQQAIVDAVDYVKKNPLKMGLKAQHWNFIIPIDS